MARGGTRQTDSSLASCLGRMGNAQASSVGQLGQCAGCCESRTDVDGMQTTVVLAKPPVKESENLYGVGLVFRTTRDGKMVVSSFVKDSSAYECGLVRDGGDETVFVLPAYRSAAASHSHV